MNTLEGSISAYLTNVLTTPWSDVFKQMDAFIKKFNLLQILLTTLAHTLNRIHRHGKTSLRKLLNLKPNALAKSLGHLRILIQLDYPKS